MILVSIVQEEFLKSLTQSPSAQFSKEKIPSEKAGIRSSYFYQKISSFFHHVPK
jgi:hypothetical protein